MLEILYRIYQVPTEKEKTDKERENIDDLLMSERSISKLENIEIAIDCLICEDRNHFKEIIRDLYGEKIPFKYSRKLQAGDLYCIIIGEHCYNIEKYFNKKTFVCDYCGTTVETYAGNPTFISEWELKSDLYNISEYSEKKFCNYYCKEKFIQREKREIQPSDNDEFYIQRDSFTEKISGYIYKITKKDTGEFYIGQTIYAPIFRWGQHLKTQRFDIKDIENYQFETLEIVPFGENILEIEKKYIKEFIDKFPEKCLNVVHNSIK